MATRDLSKREFHAALARHGMRPVPYMGGYVDIGDGVQVYGPNGGDRYRDQLAYLMQQKGRHA